MMNLPPIRLSFPILAALTILAVVSNALAQQQAFPPPPHQQSSDTSSNLSSSDPTGLSDFSRNSLTAAQIDDVLERRPELVVELKSLVADQLQQQGINTQADSITDEQLFHQITVSADLVEELLVCNGVGLGVDSLLL